MELKIPTKQSLSVYGGDAYEKRDRKAILRAMRAMRDNPMGHLNAKGIKVEISSETLSKVSKSGDFIETDYH